jgi:hypothetical protein
MVRTSKYLLAFILLISTSLAVAPSLSALVGLSPNGKILSAFGDDSGEKSNSANSPSVEKDSVSDKKLQDKGQVKVIKPDSVKLEIKKKLSILEAIKKHKNTNVKTVSNSPSGSSSADNTENGNGNSANNNDHENSGSGSGSGTSDSGSGSGSGSGTSDSGSGSGSGSGTSDSGSGSGSGSGTSDSGSGTSNGDNGASGGQTPSNNPAINSNQSNSTQPVNGGKSVQSEVVPPVEKPETGSLDLKIAISKDSILAGQKQTVTVSVTDSKTGLPVAAGISGGVKGSSFSLGFSGNAGSSGKVKFSFPISKYSEAGDYSLTIKAKGSGYKGVSESGSFTVKGIEVPIVAVVNNYNKNNVEKGQSITAASGAATNKSNSPETVQETPQETVVSNQSNSPETVPETPHETVVSNQSNSPETVPETQQISQNLSVSQTDNIASNQSDTQQISQNVSSSNATTTGVVSTQNQTASETCASSASSVDNKTDASAVSAECTPPPAVQDCGSGIGNGDGTTTGNDTAGATEASLSDCNVVVTVDSAVDGLGKSLSPGQVTSSHKLTFSFSARSSAPSQGTESATSTLPDRFECSFDGGSFDPCSSPQSYSTIKTGSHNFVVRVAS